MSEKPTVSNENLNNKPKPIFETTSGYGQNILTGFETSDGKFIPIEKIIEEVIKKNWEPKSNNSRARLLEEQNKSRISYFNSLTGC